MTIESFGIWVIDDQDGLIGWVDGEWDYEVGKETLWDIRDDGYLYWDWMIHLAEKTWFTETVANDFNKAFAFAQIYFKHLKPKNLPDVSMEQSVDAQKSRMHNPNK